MNDEILKLDRLYPLDKDKVRGKDFVDTPEGRMYFSGNMKKLLEKSNKE